MLDFNQEMDRITAVLDRMQSDVDKLKVELDIPASVQTMSDLKEYRHRQALARVQEMLRSTDWELEESVKVLGLEVENDELEVEIDEFPTYDPAYQPLFLVDLLDCDETLEEELARLQTQQLRVDEELSKLNVLLSL